MAEDTRWIVREVHNFGGFFGGDTVTLTAERWPQGDEETFTIDAQALLNVPERHTVAPAMVFDFVMAGDRVDCAELLAAVEWPLLEAALDLSTRGPLREPRVRAYRCDHCRLWVVGEPDEQETRPRCRLCQTPLHPAV